MRFWAGLLLVVSLIQSDVAVLAQQATPEPVPLSTVAVNVVDAITGAPLSGMTVCVSVVSDGAAPEQCFTSDAVVAPTFTVAQGSEVVWQLLPDAANLYAGNQGSWSVAFAPSDVLTIAAQPMAPTPTIVPPSTMVPTIAPEPTATVVPSAVPTEVQPAATVEAARPAANAGMFAPGDPGTVTFTLVPPAGDTLPAPGDSTYVFGQLCVTFVDGSTSCQLVTSNTVQVTGPEGPATYVLRTRDPHHYSTATGSVTVVGGTDTPATIQLEPVKPGQLGMDVQTQTGAPIPDGTTVCYMPEGGAEVCQTLAHGQTSVVVSDIAPGFYSVSVTPPAGSGFDPFTAGTTVNEGLPTHVSAILPATITATVVINVTTETGAGAVPQYTYVCLQPADAGGRGDCAYYGQATYEPAQDAYVYTVQVAPGNYTWSVDPQTPEYIDQNGSVTAVGGQTVTVQPDPVVLRPSAGDSDLEVTVTTEDGAPVPAGSTVCVQPYRQAQVCQTVGDGTQTSVVVTFPGISEGTASIWGQGAPGSGYQSTWEQYYVTAGQPAQASVVLPKIVTNAITKTVDPAEAYPGQDVNYTISGTFTGRGFVVSDQLPAGFTVTSVTCSGDFVPMAGQCYDLYNGTLVVAGQGTGGYSGSFTITVSGTASGQIGTDVVNTACMVSQSGGSSSRSTREEGGGTSQEVCSSATFRIVDPPVAALTLDKELTAVNGQTPDGPAHPGDELTYTLTATNAGEATLTGVVINDPLLPELTCVPAMPATLLPGASMVCTGTYVITADEAADGIVANTATAQSDQTPPTDDSVTWPVVTTVTPIAPTVQPVCGANNDIVTVPEQPSPIVVTTQGWSENTYVVTFTVPVNYEKSGQTEYTFTDANEPCPTEVPTQTPQPTETPTPLPGTVVPTATATPPTVNPTATMVPPSPTAPVSPDETPVQPTATTAAAQTTTPVSGLPSTGARADGVGGSLALALMVAAGGLMMAGAMARRGRRA